MCPCHDCEACKGCHPKTKGKKPPPRPAAPTAEPLHCNTCVADIAVIHIVVCDKCGSKLCPVCLRRFGVPPAKVDDATTTPAKCSCGRL